MKYEVSSLKGCIGYVKGQCEYAIVDSDGGICYCTCKSKRDAEWIASLMNENWKPLCCKFIGRTRRLERFKKINLVGVILREEKKLVQKAYDEMTQACLKDKEYQIFWGHNEETDKSS